MSAHEYVKTQVTMVDQKQLLLLMFDGGQRFLRQARAALAADDLPRFSERLARGQAIIAELLGTLDYDGGGDVAPRLAALYEFMLGHLTEANATRSIRHMDDVLGVLGTIAGAYREIIDSRAA